MLTVVIPTRDAANVLPPTVGALGTMPAEIVVADGGSTDGTVALAGHLGARVIAARRGRGPQLAAGAAAARGPWLLLLHADTRLAAGWEQPAIAHMQADPNRAGFFKFALDSAHPHARRLEMAVAWRCRVLALPYGDQGLLIHRTLLGGIGGIRPLPLMEDVDLVRRLGRKRLVALDARAITSAKRWERDGWQRRSLRNLACLGLYFAGVPPSMIARLYG